MKHDLGLTLTAIVGAATFAIALVAGIFVLLEAGAATAQEARQPAGPQVAFHLEHEGKLPSGLSPAGRAPAP